MNKIQKNNQLLLIIPWLLIVFLIILNLNLTKQLWNAGNTQATDQPCLTERKKDDSKYSDSQKNYKEINYKTFKKLYKGKESATIAVVDNTSNTYDKFIEFINKTSYYNDLNINLLITSKLSKKNLVDLYELDDRFADLESNYIIVVRNNKVLALVELSNVDLVDLIETYE